MSKTAIASAYHYLGISSADLAVLVYDTFNLNSDRDSFVDSRTIIRCFDAVTTPAQYPEPPDEFIQDRVKYMRRAKTTRKAARLGPSHVGKLFVINGTSGVRSHLDQKHHIDPQSGKKRRGSSRAPVLEQQRSAAATSTFFWRDSIEKFKELLFGGFTSSPPPGWVMDVFLSKTTLLGFKLTLSLARHYSS
ncbi:hypothetical protein V2A60_008815 [Cordyceps javanica]